MVSFGSWVWRRSTVVTAACWFVVSGASFAQVSKSTPSKLVLPSREWRVHSYSWGSDRELIACYESSDVGLCFGRMAVKRTGAGAFTVTGYSGITLPFGIWSALAISPDGRYYLGRSDDGEALLLDRVTKRKLGWAGPCDYALWAKHDNSFLAVHKGQLATSVAVESFGTAGARSTSGGLGVGISHSLLGRREVIAFTAPERALCLRGAYWSNATSADEVNIRTGQSVREVRPGFPAGSIIASASVSPDFKFMCWLVLQPHVALRGPRADMELLTGDGRLDITLWTTDINGRGLVRLGSATSGCYRNSLVRIDAGYPRDLRWAPDGRTVSYLNDNQIWTMDIDK